MFCPYLHGSPLIDASGLGRWSGFSRRGANSQYLSIITAYRTCKGSNRTAPIGSTFLREYKHFRSKGIPAPQPRKLFLQDLQTQLQHLQDANHSIILMLDANSTIKGNLPFASMLSACGLHDLHALNPAPSTYMGARERRIDFMFGCHHVVNVTQRQGTLVLRRTAGGSSRFVYRRQPCAAA